MKTCKVYELAMREEYLPVDQDYMEHRYLGSTSHVDLCRGMPPVLFDSVEVKHIPVQTFCEHKLPEYIKGGLNTSDYKTDYTFLVIDPELEKLLMVKYIDKINTLEEDINNLKSMSFWERVKFMFKGDKYFKGEE